jgi:hypothetical protein
MKKFLPLHVLFLLFFNSNLKAQSGSSCGTAISVTPTFTCSINPCSTTLSASWYKFVATSPYMQIIEASAPYGNNAPHIHKLTLYSGVCNNLQVVEEEELALIPGAFELNIDASDLTVGATYFIKVSRSPGGKICPGVATSGATCGGTSSITFALCVRYLNVIIPKDFNSEAPAVSHTYYQNKGQIVDVNRKPRFDVLSYTNSAYPAVYNVDTTTAFVFSRVDTIAATPDTLQRVDMVLVGANNRTPLFKTEKTDGYLNYFLGHVPTGATNIKGYSRTVKNDIYPNIDMQTYSNNSGIKFYFIVRPLPSKDESAVANPANIILEFKGANTVSVTPSGGLKITTKLGILDFETPHAYQLNNSNQIVPVTGAKFVQLSPTKVTFNNPSYSQSKPLFIQVDRGHAVSPLHGVDNHEWVTYFGGTGYDEGRGVTTDTDGNPYFVGFTASSYFPPLFGAMQGNFGGVFDAYISKFSHPNSFAQKGDHNVWTTYYGGADDDRAFAVTSVGSGTSGKVYITGKTKSLDFPTSHSGSEYFQNSLKGTSDAFLVVLDNQFGGAQVPTQGYYYASYFGGNGDETGLTITKDNSGNVFIGGSTSTNVYSATAACTVPGDGGFPKCNAFTASYGGNPTDGFLAKFSSSGQILWSTFYGGAGEDAVHTLAVDAGNNLYIGGKTASSTGFPTKTFAGAYNQTNAGGVASGIFDGFVSKFDNTGTQLWSTYFGGSGDDVVNGIDINSSHLYITGSTSSPTPACSTACYCKVPGAGEFPLCDLKTTSATDYFQNKFGGVYDAFIARFDLSSLALSWSTYFGGIYKDEATAITVDADNITSNGTEPIISVTGQTFSENMPLHNPYIASDLIGSGVAYLYPSNSLTPYYSPWMNSFSEAYIALFSGAGSPLWGVAFGQPYQWPTYGGNERSNSIVSTKSISDKHIYTTGWTDNLYLDPVCKKPPYSDCDLWLSGNTSVAAPTSFNVRFAYHPFVVGIHENSLEENNAIVFPNPTSQLITISAELKERQDVFVSVYSMTGQKLFEENYKSQSGLFTKEINLADYSSGLYFLKIQAGYQRVNKKIIKQ